MRRDDRMKAARVAGSRRCGAAASPASFGRRPYGRGGCRARLPRHPPQPVPAVTSPMRRGAVGVGRHASRRVRRTPGESHRHRAGTPRIVRGGPSVVKGTRRSFLTASQKRSPGPTLERRSLCRPGGPDGEGQARGQARNARGEPPRLGTYHKDGWTWSVTKVTTLRPNLTARVNDKANRP